MLVVATLGRGVFSLYDVTSFFPTATVLSFGAANNDSTPIASQLTDGIDAAGNVFSRGLDKNGVDSHDTAGPCNLHRSTKRECGYDARRRGRRVRPDLAITWHRMARSTLADIPRPSAAWPVLARSISAFGTLLTGGNGQSTEFSGVMFGQGGLIKQGNGSFTFSGMGAFTG